MTILGWCFGCGRVRHWPPPWPPDRRRYHFGFMDGKRCGPVWPGIRVHDQAEADRLIPELLQTDAPGHWLEWVPGLDRLDLRPWLPGCYECSQPSSCPVRLAERPAGERCASCSHEPFGDGDECPACGSGDYEAVCPSCGHYMVTDHPDTCTIRWLRISADPDGPPVDIADVRSVVAQAREAGVPVWIERLGPHPRGEIGIGRDLVVPAAAVIKHLVGSDPAEWPSDLRRCRELPEVE